MVGIEDSWIMSTVLLAVLVPACQICLGHSCSYEGWRAGFIVRVRLDALAGGPYDPGTNSLTTGHKIQTMRPRNRTISYQRAHWPANGLSSISLQKALQICLKHLPSVADTQTEFNDGLLRLQARRLSASAAPIFLHIVNWNDRESAPVVPHTDLNSPTTNLAHVNPGSQWDYLVGDGMIAIWKDHCLILPSGLSGKNIEYYIRDLFTVAQSRGAPIDSRFLDFSLPRMANPHVIQDIITRGDIKKICFNIAQYWHHPAMDVMRERHDPALGSAARQVFTSVFRSDQQRRRFREADNVVATICVSFDGRRRGIVAEELADVALAALQEDSENVDIYTKDGYRMNSGKLMLRKKVSLPSFRTTVQRKAAWDALGQYLRELHHNGMLY